MKHLTFTPGILFALTFILLPFSTQAESGDDFAFTRGELEQMLAPIALYPDTLLAQILMASTYPLEVVEAARWSRNNSGVSGSEAVDAVSDRGWDPSIQALVAFPEVLARMDEDLGWTRRLGDAFLLQESEVMEAVQDLREQAYAAGTLDSLDRLRVTREREVIIIEPANPRVVYVPYYRPAYVYGSWRWPAYPPIYWTPPRPYAGTRIVWASGVYVSTGFYYSRPNWRQRQIMIVNVHRHPVRVRDSAGRVHNRQVGAQPWRHQAMHRRGVAYRSESLNQRYGGSSASGVRGLEDRRQWRQDRASSDRFHHSRNQRTRTSTPSGADRTRTTEATRRASRDWTQMQRSTATTRFDRTPNTRNQSRSFRPEQESSSTQARSNRTERSAREVQTRQRERVQQRARAQQRDQRERPGNRDRRSRESADRGSREDRSSWAERRQSRGESVERPESRGDRADSRRSRGDRTDSRRSSSSASNERRGASRDRGERRGR